MTLSCVAITILIISITSRVAIVGLHCVFAKSELLLGTEARCSTSKWSHGVVVTSCTATQSIEQRVFADFLSLKYIFNMLKLVVSFGYVSNSGVGK